MRENVLGSEPDIALFVDDNNPLKYYEKIACQANNSLNKKDEDLEKITLVKINELGKGAFGYVYKCKSKIT